MNASSHNTDPIVRIRGLRKSFGAQPVLQGIDLDVLPSQVVVVIGPSGTPCAKRWAWCSSPSTCLRT